MIASNALGRTGADLSPLTSLAQVNALSFASANLATDPLFNGPNDWRLKPTSPCIDAGTSTVLPGRPQALYDESRILDGNLNGNATPDIGADEFTHVELSIPVDSHLHIHFDITDTSGLPLFLAADLTGNPAGLLLPGLGHLFLGASANLLVLPFGTVPSNAVVDYPAGVPSGVLTYWQAIVGDGVGIVISNPSVHVTN